MDIVLILFYIFGTTSIAAAAFMLYTKNVLYAAFGLLITLLSLSAIFTFCRFCSHYPVNGLCWWSFGINFIWCNAQ